MTEVFTAIVFEALIAGAWVDITPDVLFTPEPKVSGMGIAGNSIRDRVGENGTLTFSLDNSTGNSGGVVGYYTPYHTSVRTGFSQPIGIPVHVYFEWNGIRRYKYFGLVEPGGWKVIAMSNGPRRVDVKCSNWIKLAADHTLDLMGYTLNTTFDEGIRLVIRNMPRTPQNYLLRSGNTTFPTLFDVTRATTKALGEIEKLTLSEFGRSYITADGQSGERLVLEHRRYRTEHYDEIGTAGDRLPQKASSVTSRLLLNAGGNLLLNAGGELLLNETIEANFNDTDFTGFIPSFGENMANRVIFKTYPRSVDAAATTVLWSLDEPIALTAGEERDNVRGTFRDPDNPDVKINGIELVTPVSGTDYAAFENEDGTGTDYTSSLTVIADLTGTAEARYTLKNTAGVTIYVTLLQVRGKGVRIYNPSEQVYDYTALDWQRKAGIITLTLDLYYLDSIDSLYVEEDGNIWATFLAGVAVPEPRVKSVSLTANNSAKSMAAFMCLEPGMMLMINETVSKPSDGSGWYNALPWFVNGYDFVIKGMKIVEWRATLQPAGRNQ